MSGYGESDELRLMAYADGELSPAEEAEVEAWLARDARAHERVRRYRETAAMVRAAFQATLAEPVPPTLEAAIRGGGGQVLPFVRRGLRRVALPLAASIALVIGGLLGSFWSRAPVEPLALALEHTPSGEPGPGGVVPVASYRLPGGEVCRRFDRIVDDLRFEGLACRSGDGGWRTLALAAGPARQQRGYAPAEGGESVVDRVLAQLGPAQPLDPAVERTAIARGWRLGPDGAPGGGGADVGR